MRTECHAHPVPSGSAAPEGRPGQSRGLCLVVPWSGGEGLAAPSVSVHVCSPDSKLSKILKVLLQHRCQVYTPTHPSLQGPQSQESLLQEGLWDTGPWWRDIRQLEGALGRDEVVPLLCHVGFQKLSMHYCQKPGKFQEILSGTLHCTLMEVPHLVTRTSNPETQGLHGHKVQICKATESDDYRS